MIKVYGHSDDCFEIEGIFRGENEYSCYDTPVTLIVNDFTFDKSVIITGEYAPKGAAAVWHIGVEPVDEDKPMPEMKIEMAKNGYSPMLIIDCSSNTAVSKLNRS